ncbi:MAG: helix-turn-helix transcriptional regulator [Ekhidna sp.]|nr:helix-turn-helix transcriptional regulator [Ekhidna sp.]MBC6410688.1 helix-turn-helix transcriptional regulator [Ekhidna sp.]MBC6426796.1 helix-turn-helix transcriptional regulator [Ekhidna sp.]
MLEYHEKIKKIRLEKNLSQDWIASQLGISQRSYSNIENGQTQLTVDRLFQISEVFKVNAGEIIGVENQNINTNNFNNNATQNNSSLVVNRHSIEEIRMLYERILKDKDEEIQFLRSRFVGK